MKADIKLISVFAFICLVCLLIMTLGNKGINQGTVAQIKLGDKVIRTINLSEVNEPYEFKVQTDDGGYNIIYVENGKIMIKDSDCPDKICVKQGYAYSGSLPIICLPHKLSVVILGKPEIDAVAGGQ
ncbi:MAG: NusG domain II-containing protein [Clostridia bacterium]|nr:NusG domain II-containing protein [Clostridia bacterium]